jgi:cation transport regulator ChaC
MEDTWVTRDLPVLDAVVRYMDEHVESSKLLQGSDIAQIVGMDVATVGSALVALNGVYVNLGQAWAEAGGEFVQSVSAEARRVVGQWPSPATYIERLLQALEQQEATSTDVEEKSNLRRAIEGLRGVGRDVLVGVATNVLTGAV